MMYPNQLTWSYIVLYLVGLTSCNVSSIFYKRLPIVHPTTTVRARHNSVRIHRATDQCLLFRIYL